MHLSRRRAGPAIASLVALALAGCLETTLRTAPPDLPVSLESLDGPPEAVRNRLAGFLAAEAAQRQMRLVAAGSPARYRLRGHLAAAPSSGVTYVWDIYDDAAQRTQRVAGESPARVGALTDPWAGMDDATLQGLARRSLDGITVFLVQSQASPTGVTAEAAEAE